MPDIPSLVLSLSLDVTEQLVAQGIVSTALTTDANGNPITVIGASATTPIVLTLSAPAPWGGASPQNPQRITAVVDGIEGMVEANGTWMLTPTDPGASTVTLTTYFDQTSQTYTNVLQNSVGTHAYTGGGTITTALTDGRITLGEQHLVENIAPPRIMLVPIGAKFDGADENDRRQGGVRRNLIPGHDQTAEQVLEQSARMVAGETLRLNVVCWGAANPPDPDFDFVALQLLCQQVIRSLYYLAEGCYTLGDGKFSPQRSDQLGQKMTFPLHVFTPVLDYILGTTTVQTVAATVEVTTPQDSTPEVAWTGDIPE